MTSESGFVHTENVLFRHCDPAGIVFFPRYFEMINDALEAFFVSLDAAWDELHKNHAVPTVQIAANFAAPSYHGDVISIALACPQVGRSSLSLAFTGTCDGEVRFEATSTIVYVDADGKATPWPEVLRAKLERHV